MELVNTCLQQPPWCSLLQPLVPQNFTLAGVSTRFVPICGMNPTRSDCLGQLDNLVNAIRATAHCSTRNGTRNLLESKRIRMGLYSVPAYLGSHRQARRRTRINAVQVRRSRTAALAAGLVGSPGRAFGRKFRETARHLSF